MSSRSYQKLKNDLNLLTRNKDGIILEPSILLEEMKNGLSKIAIQRKYKLTHRTACNTWRYAKEHWPALAKKLRSKAHSQVSMGNQKGKKDPKIRVAKKDLEEALNQLSDLKSIKDKFGFSDFLLHRNIVENNLQHLYQKFKRFPFRSIVITERCLSVLKSICPDIDQVFDDLKINPNENLIKLHKAFIELNLLSYQLYRISKTARYKSKKSFTRNLGYLHMADILYSQDIEFESEYKLSNRYYDFYLPEYNLLVEVDGGWHNIKGVKEKDTIKTEIAKNANIDLIRVKWTGTKLNYEALHKAIQDRINTKDRKETNL